MKLDEESQFKINIKIVSFFGLIVILLFNYDSFIEKRVFIKI